MEFKILVDINILNLFLKSSLTVKFVTLILISFSIVSWAIIFQKINILNTATRELEVFENKFWSGITISHLYEKSQKHYDSLIGLERIFCIGFREFSYLYQMNQYAMEVITERARQMMHISTNRELKTLITHISFLGTIGSISPYIGLFGTVLGIMHVFISFSTEKQVTLQMIAPGISEALMTTATGLFTAIPAVMAVNYLNQLINNLELSYGNFIEDFIEILHYQTFIKTENPKE